MREISTCRIQLFLADLQRFFRLSPSPDLGRKPTDFAMTAHERAHSRRDIENLAAADGVPRCGFAGGRQHDASVLCHGRRTRRCRTRVVLTIPRRVLPAVDQTVVAAERALPHNLSGRTVQFSDDLAAAAPATRAALQGTDSSANPFAGGGRRPRPRSSHKTRPYPERNRHLSDPACAAGLTASRAERMPAS